jgi:SnoaL-like protein
MVNKHVEDWLSAWNKHDLTRVLSMYSEDIEFSSPKIKVVFPDRALSKITNKKDLEEYWTKALEKYPKLNFVLKESIFYNNKCLVEYYALLDEKTKTSVIEKFEMQDGLIIKSSAYYGADEPP